MFTLVGQSQYLPRFQFLGSISINWHIYRYGVCTAKLGNAALSGPVLVLVCSQLRSDMGYSGQVRNPESWDGQGEKETKRGFGVLLLFFFVPGVCVVNL